MRQSVLITGGSGLLATNWACAIRNDWNVFLAIHKHKVELNETRTCILDLANRKLLADQIDKISPDLLVHTAGMTNVDECENAPDLAVEINSKISRNMAKITASKKIPFIHISTDHLFTGNNSFYKEDDPTDPINNYGYTKALAEEWIQHENTKALIIRTNFFGWGNKNRQSFSDWLISNLRSGKKVGVFKDVFFTPIIADKVAINAHELVSKGAHGIYNIVGEERISKYDFAIKICNEFELPIKLVCQLEVEQANLGALRPKDMSLDNTKSQVILRRNIGTINDFVQDLRKQEISGRRAELYDAIY